MGEALADDPVRGRALRCRARGLPGDQCPCLTGVRASQLAGQPHPIAQRDPLDLDRIRVARSRYEGVALDGLEAKTATLIEAKVADVRRSGGDSHPPPPTFG